MEKMTLLVGEDWTLTNGVVIHRGLDTIDANTNVRREWYTIHGPGVRFQSFKTLGAACFEANHAIV